MILLDLYCGTGVGAWGYWRSGRFSQIVGVDTDDEKLAGYSFDKINANALSLDYDFLAQFDFIHASPPCQAYSKMTVAGIEQGIPPVMTKFIAETVLPNKFMIG